MTANREMKWQTLKSEYIIKRPWLTARRDEVLLPTGAVNSEYYVLEYPDWVNVVAVTTGGMLVFVRQYRHGLGETSPEICAGVMEQGEEPLDAVKRELEEETGYAVGHWTELMTLSQNASTCTNLTHCFLAVGVEKVTEQHLDETEDIDVCLYTKEEVKGMLCRNEIKQALMAAPLWKCFAEDLL